MNQVEEDNQDRARFTQDYSRFDETIPAGSEGTIFYSDSRYASLEMDESWNKNGETEIYNVPLNYLSPGN